MLLRNILVPLDGSPLSERALPYAAELARSTGASLTLVRAADVHPRSSADKPLFGTRRSRPKLLRQMWPRSGLVVISTHGRTGLSRAILGSEADGVVYGDDVPVVLVHPHAADPMQEVDQTPAMFGRGAHANA